MSSSSFDTPAITYRIIKAVLRVQSAWLRWGANPTSGSFDDKMVATLVKTLDAHARAYLAAVEHKGLLREYHERIREVGRALIRNAEERSLLSDPYSEDRLRKMAESCRDYLPRKTSLTPQQRESQLCSEVARLHAATMKKAEEWQAWKTSIVVRIETEFEARYRYWLAEAIEKLEGPGSGHSPNPESEPEISAKPGEVSVAPVAVVGGHRRNARTNLKVTNWEEIEICFISDHRVQIRRGEEQETRNYTEMGFEDGRTKNPNRAWRVLQDLAESRGVLTRASRRDSTWEKIEKRMQAVRKSLRSYFGLEADPPGLS